jgi:hypothetical protein
MIQAFLFLLESCILHLLYKEQNRPLLQKNWLTRGLTQEIKALYPTPLLEIQKYDNNKCDPAAFQQKIAKLSPLGRMFASCKQLDQAADMFLGAWAVKKTDAIQDAFYCAIQDAFAVAL